MTLGPFASIHVNGGAGTAAQAAGTVVVESEGDLVLEPDAAIRAPALGGFGDGGFIALRAVGRLELRRGALIDARARPLPASGLGNAVEISACFVRIERYVDVRASGFSGAGVEVVGGRELFVDGKIDVRGGLPSTSGAITFGYGLERVCSGDPEQPCETDAECSPGTCLPLNPSLGPNHEFKGASPELVHDQRLARCG